MDDKRAALVERALREGLLGEAPSAESLQAPVTLETALELAFAILDKINPPGRCYD